VSTQQSTRKHQDHDDANVGTPPNKPSRATLLSPLRVTSRAEMGIAATAAGNTVLAKRAAVGARATADQTTTSDVIREARGRSLDVA
jgi:hypothetical protein